MWATKKLTRGLVYEEDGICINFCWSNYAIARRFKFKVELLDSFTSWETYIGFPLMFSLKLVLILLVYFKILFKFEVFYGVLNFEIYFKNNFLFRYLYDFCLLRVQAHE